MAEQPQQSLERRKYDNWYMRQLATVIQDRAAHRAALAECDTEDERIHQMETNSRED